MSNFVTAHTLLPVSIEVNGVFRQVPDMLQPKNVDVSVVINAVRAIV
jgi:hypothetical protein